MVDWFDREVEQLAFRLELETDSSGREHITWHGMEAGKPVVYKTEPHTGFWRRFGVSLMKLLPIESQL